MSARTKILTQCFNELFYPNSSSSAASGSRSAALKRPTHLAFAPPVISELSLISEILPGQLYLSGSAPVTDENLRKHSITGVVRLLTDLEYERLFKNRPVALGNVLHIRIPDSADSKISAFFDSVTDFIDGELRNNGRVLVHCVAGISRSTTLVMAYLIRYANYRLMDAYDFVISKRKIAEPNDSFFQQLLQYDARLRSGNDAAVLKRFFIENETSKTKREDGVEMIEIRSMKVCA